MPQANVVSLSQTRSGPQVEQFVTFKVGDQFFGVPALQVRDVLRRQPLTRVPLARPEIAGTINLRGHIVAAIDLRTRLSVQGERPEKEMSLVVEGDGEPYCLIIDAVGDVIDIEPADIEPVPSSLPKEWADVASGIYRSAEHLTLLLGINQLLAR